MPTLARNLGPLVLTHNQQCPGDADPRDFKVNRAGPLAHGQDANDPDAQRMSHEKFNRGALPRNSVDRRE